jgi:hypothetical protein
MGTSGYGFCMKTLQASLIFLCLLGAARSEAHMRKVFQSHDETLINLARADRDQPGDNSFTLSGAQYTVDALNHTLTTRLPDILSLMKPTTDDSTIRDVTVQVNGNNIAFDFQKQVTIFWKSTEISGTTSVESASCPSSDQTGFEVLMNTSGSTSAAQGYVNAARILICASIGTDANGPTLVIEMERDLYAGPQYADWIGLLMGDFLRPFGQALQAGLK